MMKEKETREGRKRREIKIKAREARGIEREVREIGKRHERQ
jgi:hypothetical protein